MTKAQMKERDEAIATLRAKLKPGSTVYTIMRHVSKSGMQRVIDLAIKTDDGIENIGWLAARAIGAKFVNDRYYGIKVTGVGMDMGFHLVYSLSHVLFPKGFGIATDDSRYSKSPLRPETPEQAADMVASGVKFYGRNGDRTGWDTDGGYALKHTWL